MIDSDNFNEMMAKYGIPEHMWEAVRRYILEHTRPGSFLLAVLRNNLKTAVALADDDNYQALRGYMKLMHWEFPSKAHGSKDAVAAWLKVVTRER